MKLALKILVTFAFAAATFFIARDMDELKDSLWGMRPLWLFMSGWIAFLTAISGVISRLPNREWLITLSFGSGVLFALGFPTSIFTPVMFVAFLPLLYTEQYISLSKGGLARWTVFKFAFITFYTWNILSTYWVANSSLSAGMFANFANSLLMCIPFVLFHQTKVRLGAKIGYASLIAYWLVFEFIHLRWDLTWAWLNLGNAFAEMPEVIQWYELTGVPGGTLWILLINVLFFTNFFYREELSLRIIRVPFPKLIPIFALILFPAGLSYWRYSTYKETGKEVEVVVVQPNYEPHYEKFVIPDDIQMERFVQLSQSKITPQTQYLLFPESSFGDIWHQQMAVHPTIKSLQNLVNVYPNLSLIAGLSSYSQYQNANESKSGTARTIVRPSDGSTLIYDSHNSAIQITEGSDSIPLYFKSKLVPGVEALPYYSILSFAEEWVQSFGGSGGSLGTGQPDVFWNKSKTIAVSPVICYESIFGEYCTDYIKKGANALFIITNDGWWDDTAGYKQHKKFAVLRAIETRRSIARSANTGSSCFINQRGDILQATAYNQETAIRGSIHLNDTTTFYVRFGDYLSRIAILMATICWIWGVSTIFIKKKPLQA